MKADVITRKKVAGPTYYYGFGVTEAEASSG
jgi:hypothetical protein